MGTETYSIDETIIGFIIDLKALPEEVVSKLRFEPVTLRKMLQAHLSNQRGSATIWVTTTGKAYVGYLEDGKTFEKVGNNWVEGPQTPETLWGELKYYFGDAYVEAVKPTQELSRLRVAGRITRTFRANDDGRFAKKVLTVSKQAK